MTVQSTTTETSRGYVAPAEDSLLRLALKGDAAVTALNAVAYLAGFALLDGSLGVPAPLLVSVGAFLLAFAGLVGRLSTQPVMARAAVAGVIAANALGVAGLATLQYLGLRSA